MGGNAKAIDRVSGKTIVFESREAYADKIDLREVNTEQFKDDLITTLLKLNAECRYLWHSPIPVATGEVFNGSAINVFNVPQNELLQHKMFLGDVDVMVPIENIQRLFDTLASLENLNVGNMVYVGQNRPTLRGETISSLFFHQVMKKFVQIDFEGVDFTLDKPSDFAKFAHSSPWIDQKHGLKGVAHKYLLMVLTWVMNPVYKAVILTDKSPVWPPEKIRRKTLHQPPRAWSFSVDKGLRKRLKVQYHRDAPVRLSDGTAFKEIATSDSTYITDLGQIYSQIFKLVPMEGDIERLGSFVGLIELCKLHVTPHEMRDVFDQLCNYKLFGSGQALSRNSAAEDRETKSRIIEHLLREFPFLRDSKTPVADLMTAYYKTYKERTVE